MLPNFRLSKSILAFSFSAVVLLHCNLTSGTSIPALMVQGETLSPYAHRNDLSLVQYDKGWDVTSSTRVESFPNQVDFKVHTQNQPLVVRGGWIPEHDYDLKGSFTLETNSQTGEAKLTNIDVNVIPGTQHRPGVVAMNHDWASQYWMEMATLPGVIREDGSIFFETTPCQSSWASTFPGSLDCGFRYWLELESVDGVMTMTGGLGTAEGVTSYDHNEAELSLVALHNVPEPASWPAITIGLLAILAGRRRKRLRRNPGCNECS